MQMEIRFASWTRAGKFRVTFVRRSNESHFGYRGGWAGDPYNSVTEMLGT